LIDETRIQLSLFQVLSKRGHIAIIPNVSWSWLQWEADLISVTKAGVMHEYEIKITLSDFKADFGKRKHAMITRPPYGRKPNYFWFVAPEPEVPICIPDYAGLIIVEPVSRHEIGHRLVTVRKARKLHAEKTGDRAVMKMLRTMMFKYWNAMKMLDQTKIQTELFRR